MKVALICDTHVGARNDNLTVLKHTERFFKDTFFPYLKEHNIKKIIHLGDVFDRRKYTNHAILSRARKFFFNPIVEDGIDMDIIIGNHDCAYRNTADVNSPSLLLKDYPFNVYSEAEYVDVGGLKLLYVPWITPETIENTMEKIGEAKAKIIMGHLEIQGFEMDRGRIADHGLNASIFEPYLSVFSGHFHYKSFSNGIIYLGTAVPLTWADYNLTKGFHILDTESLELEFVENPINFFKRVVYDDSEGEMKVDFSEYDDCYVKIAVSKKTNPIWFEKFVDSMNKTNAANVMIVEESLFKAHSINDGGNIEIEDTMTFISKYIKDTDQKFTVPKEKLLSLFDNLYRKANELEI